MKTWGMCALWLALSLSACADVETAEVFTNGVPLTLPIVSGVPVRGAGPAEQWEGIVMTRRPTGGTSDAPKYSRCSATFVTERHLLTAAHCYETGGEQQVEIHLNTWVPDSWYSFPRAFVYRAGKDVGADVAVIDLRDSPSWITPERRFRMLMSRPAAAELHMYGYGHTSEDSEELTGQLYGASSRATIAVSEDEDGYLAGVTRAVRICSGDSGGPLLKEGTVPIIWGINSAHASTVLRLLRDSDRVCAEEGARVRFASVSAHFAFIEEALGRTCKRQVLDGQLTAQCW